MLTKNLTAFAFGTKVCSRRPPQPEMTLVVRGRFRLRPGEPLEAVTDPIEQGPLTAEVYEKDDDERRGECLYGGDFAAWKPNGEVLLVGTCHAPGGKPVTELPVLFRVGAWSKILRVVGPRVWTEKLLGAAVSDPLPFKTMAISYRNAFGGPGYARNPAGKGHGTPDLPTLERAGEVIRSRSDQPEPAGFGPQNPRWPQRAGKRGKAYGEAYRKTRAPYYAEDFDWTYFQAAPADQQLQGYLTGDEELTFQNLHPTAQVLKTRLPGIRVRAFVKDVEASFREIPMVLDTLHADLDRGTIALTWRGLVAVREHDLSDVKTVLIASDKLADERLPEAHYRPMLEEFERDPVGLRKRFPPGFLDAARRSRKERAGEPLPPEPAPPGIDPIARLLHGRLGALAEDQQRAVREATKRAASAVGPHVDLDAEIAKASRAAADVPPTPFIRKPRATPALGLRRKMRIVMEQVAELQKKLEGKPISAAERARIEAMERLPHDPRWREMDPSYTPPDGPVSTEEPGPGRDLSEQDLTGRDLRGVDLTGANLEDAILTRADLRGAKLAGANLRKAILFKADLTGADLTGADLTRSNAARVIAEGAIFEGAILDLAFFERARLAGAVLREAKGEYVCFARADLTGALGQRAAFSCADFSSTKVDRADFSGASLAGCGFVGCKGAVVMTGADVARASFADAALGASIFADLRGDGSQWPRANVDGADFGFATLRRATLDRISAVGARFYGADLRHCRLYRARLDRAELVRANLFMANLSHAALDGVKFNDASLYGASFVRASGAGADFTGANLKRSTLERA